MEQRLSVITLGVDDLPRARRFYEEGLGWVASPASQEAIVFFALGGMVLALFSREALAADAQAPAAAATGFAGVTLAYNARSREEVVQVVDQAVAAGATLLKVPQDVFWGGFSGYFADPDGHAWEIAWNPHWTLGPDGQVSLEPPG